MPPKRARSSRSSSAVPGARSTSPAPSFLPSSTFPREEAIDEEDDQVGEEEDDLLDNGDMLLGDDMDEEDDEGEDLFGEDMARDYEAREALDRYEGLDVDDSAFDAMDPMQRAQVENALRERDAREGRGRDRLPAAFLGDEDEFAVAQENARRRRRMDDEMNDQDESDEIDPEFPLEDLKGATVAEWVTIGRTRRHIKWRFRRFLVTFVDETGTAVYAERIKAMCEANQESLLISYAHLTKVEAAIAYFLAQAPAQVLPILDETCFEVVLSIFTDYDRIRNEVKARIIDVPAADSLRELRYIHLNRLVRVSGVVTRRTAVLPQLKYVKYDCVKCGNVLGPYYQDVSSEIKIGACPSCESKGPFPINSEQTTYRNYQKLSLQESPGSVPPGRLPRSKEVVLLGDLVDAARPGEEIEVTGIYMNNWDIGLNLKNGFPVFATMLEANSICKKEDQFAAFRLTEDEKRDIRNLARDDRIGKRIIKSIVPSIYGHENIKTAIALSLFGGESKNIQNKHRIRGDINILLLGDPGTAKSQFLKYIEKTAHRAIYTTGQGATAVGLTATVRKDPVTREWTLEGGALVLADKGVCLIDEFDKMNDADRTSIHEAMEQQSISISKAGIVTSLQARCSVIAAANPIKGRYNVSQTFLENVDLTEPILSRFDCLCVVRDTVDPLMDEQLARFVVNSHRTSHPSASYSKHAPVSARDPDIIDQNLLRKYIMFAKDKMHPKLAQMDQDKVARLYADLRRESINCNSIPITARHLESIIRMAEANAKMHLREYVRTEDVNLAIRVMLESFISANKIGVMKTLRKRFGKYLSYMRDTDELLMHLLRQLTKNNVNYHQYKYKEIPDAVVIDMDELEAKAREYEINQLDVFYESAMLAQNGYQVNLEDRTLLKTI